MSMRLFRRLLLTAALVTAALLTSSPRAQANDYCWQEGNCYICCFPWDTCCSMSCEPCCDQWLC